MIHHVTDIRMTFQKIVQVQGHRSRLCDDIWEITIYHAICQAVCHQILGYVALPLLALTVH